MSSLFLIYATLISAPLNLEVRLAKRPLAGQAIQVVGFKNGEQVFKKDLKTDAAGRASVEIPSKLEAYILAQTIYQNVSYNSGILNSQALPKAVIPLTVFPTVANDSRVFVEDLRLFATETDQGVQIDEDILILNPTDKAVVGKASESESHETPESFRFQLPKGAFDLKFETGFSQETTRFEGNDIILARPLLPGRTHLGLQYTLERDRFSVLFQQELALPVRQLSVGALATDLRWEGLDFISGPQKWFDSSPAFTWSHTFSTPTPRIQFKISGLHLQYRPAEFIAPLALLFLIALLFLLRKRKGSEVFADSDLKPELEEWVRIEELRKRDLLSVDEAYSRKLKCLEKLIPRLKNQIGTRGA